MIVVGPGLVSIVYGVRNWNIIEGQTQGGYLYARVGDSRGERSLNWVVLKLNPSWHVLSLSSSLKRHSRERLDGRIRQLPNGRIGIEWAASQSLTSGPWVPAS